MLLWSTFLFNLCLWWYLAYIIILSLRPFTRCWGKLISSLRYSEQRTGRIFLHSFYTTNRYFHFFPLLAPMSKEPFCPETFARIGLSVHLLRAALWILQPLILVWRSHHCAEPAEISEKVDIRAAVFTCHTCSRCNVSPLAVRGLPLCLCGAWACVCCFAHGVSVSCAPVYVVSRVSVVSLKCDAIILWWWKVDFVQLWSGGGGVREEERRGVVI